MAFGALTGQHAKAPDLAAVVTAANGTAVCGELPAGDTHWTATDSPYQVCANGITVPSGATLTFDGSEGPVSVQALGAGGIAATGGTLQTTGVSSTARIAFDGPAQTPGSWAGLSAGPGSSMQLAFVDVSDAVTGISATQPAGTVTIQDSSVTRAGSYGIALHGSQQSPLAVQLQRVQVAQSGNGSGVARAPAVLLDQVTATFGGGQDVDALTGGGNGIDGIVWAGTLNSNVTWPTVTNVAASHTFGLIPNGLTVNGDVVLPTGAIVKGFVLPGNGNYLTVNGGFDASARDASILSANDAYAGASMCPSTLVANCTPTDQGLDVRLPNGRAVDLTQTSVRYTGLSVTGPDDASASVVDSSFNLQSGFQTDVPATVTGSTFTTFGGLGSDGPSLSITDSSFSTWSAVLVTAGNLAVDGSAFDQSSIRYNYSSNHDTVSITHSSFSNAMDSAVNIQGHQNGSSTSFEQPTFSPGVTLQGDTFTRNGVLPNRTRAPALLLHAVTINLTDTSVTGSGNGIDAIAVSGRQNGSFTWVTPTQSADPHALGYLIEGQLRVSKPAVVTIPAGAVVKGEDLDLEGSTLDATAGGATFTGLWDNRLAAAACPTTLTTDCATPSQPGEQVRINLLPAFDGSHEVGDVTIAGASLHYAFVGSADFPVYNDDTRLGGSLTVTNSSADDTSFQLTPGTLNLQHDNLSASTIYAAASSVTIGYTRITAVTSRAQVPIQAYGPGTVSMVCDAVTNNPGAAGITLPASSSVTDSDLYANRAPDLFGATGGATTTANGVYWGQPGGPVSGQVEGNVTVTASADSPHSQAVTTLSGSAVRSPGSVGTGTLNVAVAFSRHMDPSIPLSVTLVGPNGVAHPIGGAWTDATHWAGSYAVTSTSASSGASHVNVAAGRSCIPDPATNLMTPSSTAVQVSVPTPTAIEQRYAALGGSGSALGNPVGAEAVVGSGRGQRYQNGDIYWTSGTGAHEIIGAIDTRYRIFGATSSVLGFPLTGPNQLADKGLYSRFQGGLIYWSSATGAHVVFGPILQKWAALGSQTGRLGYPITDVIRSSSEQKCTFQHGTIVYNIAKKTVTVTYG